MSSSRGVKHDSANEVIGQKPHPELLSTAIGGLAGKLTEFHGGFDVVQSQFHLPSSRIEFQEFIFRVEFFISEGSDKLDGS